MMQYITAIGIFSAIILVGLPLVIIYIEFLGWVFDKWDILR